MKMKKTTLKMRTVTLTLMAMKLVALTLMLMAMKLVAPTLTLMETMKTPVLVPLLLP